MELSLCICFGSYHILVEGFFSSSEGCNLMPILCDLDMKTSNINNCLCMLHNHFWNAKKWLLELMAAVFSQYISISHNYIVNY